MKLSACLIVKNEEQTLPRLFASLKDHVDEIIVVDTGSIDGTKQVCEYALGEKLRWHDFPWVDDFSAARQFAFDKATGDWIVWADADDVITGGENLRSIMERCDKDGVNAIVFPYHYACDQYGNTTVLQTRERLIKNNGYYKWVGKLHETLIPTNKMALAVSLSDVQWFHKTSPERVEASKLRNVEILEKAAEEEIKNNNVDPRTLYNLGNAYFTIEKYAEAIACYLKYIPQSGWVEERYLARHRAAQAMFNINHWDEGLEMSFTALEEKPQYADAYIDVGKYYYFHKQNYEKALYWFEMALKKPFPDKLPVYNPLDYTANLHWLIGHCYAQLENLRDARPHFAEYQKYFTGNTDVVEILKIIDEGLEEAENVHAITRASRVLTPETAKTFWEIVPVKYLEFPEVLHEKNKLVRKTTSSGKDMAIYCGNCVVPWDPTNEKSGGIGGSEEAIINISRHLAKMGWNITVYCRPNTPGNYEGVEYKHYTEFNPNDKWDVFVSWRIPSVFKVRINADRKYCWLHDCTPEDAFGPEILRNVDKIIVLSKYHRSLYPNIPEEKFFYSGNGLKPEHFADQIEKNPFYCIYTSSPDRGLETLLKLWPKIKKAVPQAELHWFYGWEVFDKLHKDNPQMQEYKARVKKLLDQPGVFEEGRVDHETIAKAYQKAQLWLYPTEFTETFCITGIKAQAGGALPLTTTVAALDETVQFGLKLRCSDMYSNPKMQQKFTKLAIEYLKNPATVDLERNGMSEWALRVHDWKNVALEWNREMFNSN